jgi:hypothetical protein
MGSVDIVIGRVVGIHIEERVLTQGKVDLGKVMPIARCGYFEYAVIRGDAVFEMVVPGGKEMLVGLVSFGWRRWELVFFVVSDKLTFCVGGEC